MDFQVSKDFVVIKRHIMSERGKRGTSDLVEVWRDLLSRN
jgi:hypothetical protein